jgi:hypothetical protein
VFDIARRHQAEIRPVHAFVPHGLPNEGVNRSVLGCCVEAVFRFQCSSVEFWYVL